MPAEIQPQLWVDDGPAAVAFYERALGATVVHRVSGPAGHEVVAQLEVAGARFWVANTAAAMGRLSPAATRGATARFLLVVEDPEAVVASAAAAGATVTSPVGDEHGWRLGRIVDPFGHEWEVGHPLGGRPDA
jgi:PhnB protein